MFAVDEINNSQDLLPNITLGFSVLDSCMSELRAVGGVLSLMSGLENPFPGYGCHTHSVMVGIIGDNYSFLSIPIAQITGVFQFPQVYKIIDVLYGCIYAYILCLKQDSIQTNS